ncbi:MAG: hypothetical protein A2287_05295 [Candidatus Melainabacteria bacterium RIFOXYA12_FULL_32_12]|nr:MAG: hypothetical protein A2255_08020 [Candidatus Melainabacteria bacterium RIFOXYA2_FULL_32_9]OGI31687.1 MAG: hypothetical protein A2287_05295 [Candidatus Melainabacteria bacterium RIFOXYA12_FULL_32_12]
MNTKTVAIFLSLLLLFNSYIPVACSATPQNRNQQIQQGNKYAKSGHDAYNAGQYLKAGQDYEKAYEITKTNLYIDNAVVAYKAYAYNLTNDKKYDEALKYCNKALSLNNNDKNSKELLSDIYFSRGADYFYTGNLEKAKSDFEASLKYSTLKEQTDRAKDGLAKIDTVVKKGSTVVPNYQETADTSIPAMVIIIENKIYGKTNSAAPLLTRINKIEQDTLGQTYEGDGLIVRVDRLKRTILPEFAQQTQNIGYSDIYEGTYIPEIMQQSMGKVTIIGKMPITVYIDDTKIKPYKKFYRDAAIEGFKEWEKASEGRIKFNFVYDTSRADIKVAWCEDFEDFPWQPTLQREDISAEKERIKYRKASTLVQVGSVLGMIAGGLLGVPVIGGVGAMGSSVASPILQYKGTKMDQFSHDIKINIKVTENMTDEQAKIKIKQIATHQMGHALGIAGHSNNPNDIMCVNFTATQLSDRDIKTIKEIYKSKEPDKK